MSSEIKSLVQFQPSTVLEIEGGTTVLSILLLLIVNVFEQYV
jgi:hypothetical protein